jgi:hypothetical protein
LPQGHDRVGGITPLAAADALRLDRVRAVAGCVDGPVVGNIDGIADSAAPTFAAKREAQVDRRFRRSLIPADEIVERRAAITAAASNALREYAVRTVAVRRDGPVIVDDDRS